MYSAEQRKLTIETFIQFDHSYADTIAKLGYPNRHTLMNWWKEYERSGRVPVAKRTRNPKISDRFSPRQSGSNFSTKSNSQKM